MRDYNPREIAAFVLADQLNAADYIENRLEAALAEAKLAGRDRALAMELVYGAVRWQAALDWLVARKTNGRPQPARLQVLLRLGLYQMFWLERIPNFAAVNETVAFAKRFGLHHKAGFLNAVLRGYGREREATLGLLADLKKNQPSLGYSHPQWLFDRWQARWGVEKTVALMTWNNTPPPTLARVNTLRTEAAGLRERLMGWAPAGDDYLSS